MEHKILTADQIKQVKGLGCLQDKRYTDVFNVRTITRNGCTVARAINARMSPKERMWIGS